MVTKGMNFWTNKDVKREKQETQFAELSQSIHVQDLEIPWGSPELEHHVDFALMEATLKGRECLRVASPCLKGQTSC